MSRVTQLAVGGRDLIDSRVEVLTTALPPPLLHVCQRPDHGGLAREAKWLPPVENDESSNVVGNDTIRAVL